MKKETRNRIIKWSLYALLVIATVLIFVFSTGIFGRDYHKVVDESGVYNIEIWKLVIIERIIILW